MSETPYNLRIAIQKRWLPLTFMLLCSTIGICISLALAWPFWFCLLATLLLGSLPFWLPKFTETAAMRTAELVSLALLIIIGIGVSVRALLPILTDGLVRVEAAVPLLLMTPILYIVYLALNRFGMDKRQLSVLDYLTAIFSGPPLALSLAMSVTLSTYFLLLIHYVQLHYPSWVWLADKFLERGIIPPLTLILFAWGLLLFINKAWTLWREYRLFENTATRSKSILMQAHKKATEHGGETATENFLETIWKKSIDSYIVPRYINWAVPILGFIGTVLGISLAADGIQNIISSQDGMSQFSSDLGQAIAPLGIAFDTTLIALSLSVFLMLLQTTLQHWEDNILIDYENAIRNAEHDA